MHDYVATELSWLDGIMTNPRNADLFADEPARALQRELARRWPNENRLALLDDLALEFGQDAVMGGIDLIVYENVRRGWQEIGLEGGNSLDELIRRVWGPLPEMGFRFTCTNDGRQARFRVEHCPIHETALALKAEKWLYHLVCLTDEPTTVGFNEAIEFSRTATLMEGRDHCDHCYTVRTDT
jgi:hypothetical protein